MTKALIDFKMGKTNQTFFIDKLWHIATCMSSSGQNGIL